MAYFIEIVAYGEVAPLSKAPGEVQGRGIGRLITSVNADAIVEVKSYIHPSTDSTFTNFRTVVLANGDQLKVDYVDLPRVWQQLRVKGMVATVTGNE